MYVKILEHIHDDAQQFYGNCSTLSNVMTVKEKTDQFNDHFKELVSLHKE